MGGRPDALESVRSFLPTPEAYRRLAGGRASLSEGEGSRRHRSRSVCWDSTPAGCRLAEGALSSAIEPLRHTLRGAVTKTTSRSGGGVRPSLRSALTLPPANLPYASGVVPCGRGGRGRLNWPGGEWSARANRSWQCSPPPSGHRTSPILRGRGGARLHPPPPA